ncbi:hypothetical protein [uncultured Hymenobacter sp.]|uniref:hypothetical protein n=1 Tax=uncultured Hymenobacter sp. TaxID=170016 RepID=UPI0035CAAF36
MTRLDYGIATAAYLFLASPAGWLIGSLIRYVGGSSFPTDEGTKRMGFWIGCTERLIILTFILANYYDAVGLLIAAKSILHVSDQQARKQTEYVLLGTLLSLAVAVGVGESLKLLLPTLAATK